MISIFADKSRDLILLKVNGRSRKCSSLKEAFELANKLKGGLSKYELVFRI